MLLCVATVLAVCLTGYTSAQYYSNQPPRGYPAPPQPSQQPQQQGQRNSEAWRRWYYQQRQQQQQTAYSSPRGRQPAPLASPAANSQNYNQRQPTSYAAPSSPQYSQQYYQQRPQPSPGYGPQQGYAQQPPYNNYQQPNYRPPPPATPAPPTTPAAPPVEVEFEMEVPTTTTTRPVANQQWGQYKLQSAYGARSSADVLKGLIDLVSTAAQSVPILARQSQIINRGLQTAGLRGQPPHFRQASMPVSTFLQQAQPDHKLLALLGQKSASNVRIGTSPGLSNAIHLLTRLSQGRPNPYSYPGGISPAFQRVPSRANLQHPFSKRRILPGNFISTQAVRQQLAAAKATPAGTPAPTTTPGVPVATEPLEFEGPTTTSFPRFKQAAAVNLFQAKMASRNVSLPGRQPMSAPIPHSVSPQLGQPGLAPERQPMSQMFDYQSQSYQPSQAAPPGFISIDAFRSDIMAAIQILTNEITAMVNGSTAGPTTTPSTKMSKAQELELIKSKKLAALPGGLSFLLGKFASKLTSKISSGSQLQNQVSQSLPGQTESLPTKSHPPSQWSGVFDLTPQEHLELKKGTYSRQWPPLLQTPPPQQQLMTTLATPPAMNLHVQPHQNLQPPQDAMLQSPGQPLPPEQFLGPTNASNPQQGNQSYLFEQQPPPYDPHQQGPPNMPMEPHPLDVPGHQPWQQSPPPGHQPWQQSPPPGYHQPMDFPGPQHASYQHPPPQDFPQAPPAPMWREPPSQPSQQPAPMWREPPPQHSQPPAPMWREPPSQPSQQPAPVWREPPQPPAPFNSQSHQNQYQGGPPPPPLDQNPGPQPPPMNQNTGPQPHPQQPPQPLDMPWQQPPGPQEYPPHQQQQQQQPPMDPQWQQQQQPQQQPLPMQDFPPPSNNPPMFEQQPQPNPGQNYGANQYNNQYQPGPSGSYPQTQYQPPASQSQPGGYSNGYYQQPPQPQQPQPSQPPQTSQPQQQQQYGQGGWSQPQPQSSYGAQSPQPAVDPTDPFSNKFDMNGLKPTMFNSQYQNQPPQPGGGGEFAGVFGEQNAQRQNPNAPPGKVDFGSRGPNPIQLNQFLAQPTSPKDMNALDALLGSLLSGTVAAQNSGQISIKPVQNTTAAPPPAPASSLVSDRLNGFVLGPKSEYRSNVFSEIPVNNAGYDSVNPLAGFMGETPPPPITTTPVPPGRSGDFLEGFLGVNKVFEAPKPARDNFQPNIYVYNPMNDAAPPPARNPSPPPPPPPPAALTDQALNNMGTQDLSSLVEKLLGAMATKQG